MAHTIANQKALLTRVRRIKGQLEGLERVLAEDHECLPVLQQIAAVRGAVNGLMAEVLEGHVREHLGDPSLDADERAAEVDAVVTVLRSYLK